VIAVRVRPLFAALVFAVVACAPPDPLPGYTRASAEQHATLMRAVSDYYTVRERAFVSGDASVLFAAFPKLAQGQDIREGINLDALHLPGWREQEATKASHYLESYEPTRIYVSGTAAVAFVHGHEMFEVRGGQSGGEFFTRIDLVYDADRWIVERTDEQMMAEAPPRMPKR
jgi:hypothetical protein